LLFAAFCWISSMVEGSTGSPATMYRVWAFVKRVAGISITCSSPSISGGNPASTQAGGSRISKSVTSPSRCCQPRRFALTIISDSPFRTDVLPSAVKHSNTLDVLAQVAVQVADERLKQLPVRAFLLGLDFRNEKAAWCLVPVDPSRISDVLPAPFPFP